ncbi:MAG: hypothetical protein HRT38_02785 [Alteromonadaceae bacterium]|nr:hypothetical protein [Alteromonadaceae bacterium]
MATQNEVAQHLFMSDKWVRHLVSKGILPAGHVRGKMDLAKCREAYIVYLKAINSRQIIPENEPELGELRDENIKRLTTETRLRKENYQLSVLEKKYGPLEIITTTLQRVSQGLIIGFESLSARIKQVWPDMPSEAKDVIDTVIAEGVNELADMRPDLSDFRNSVYEGSEQWVETVANGNTPNGSRVA